MRIFPEDPYVVYSLLLSILWSTQQILFPKESYSNHCEFEAGSIYAFMTAMIITFGTVQLANRVAARGWHQNTCSHIFTFSKLLALTGFLLFHDEKSWIEPLCQMISPGNNNNNTFSG